jgi:pimeloyl-ACP methyl ester carboxylesterase
MTTKFLSLADGRKIAYCLTEGKLPGVVFCGGFKSDMTGSKAMALEAFCKQRGQRFVRFDYTGHGQSSGTFAEGTIGAWRQDALDILDNVATGENVVVGSSMGGWIMLLLALARKKQVKALVGIASAPDFTEDLIWQQLTDEQREEMNTKGVIHMPSCYGEDPYPITLQLLAEGRGHCLLEQAVIDIAVPVRLIHGTKDDDVPWQFSQILMEKLASKDVCLRLVKDGGHRLSEPDQLEMMCQLLKEVLCLVE